MAQLAHKDMEASSVPPRAPLPAGTSSSGGEPSSSSSSSSPAGGRAGGAVAAVDLQAQVDELRAEVAYARAVLAQLRTKGQAGVLPGPPPGLSPSSSSSSSSS